MKIHLVLTENHDRSFLPEGNFSFLYSYANKRRIDFDAFLAISESRMIIDSGAFSVWNRGKKVDVDKYLAFLNEISRKYPGRFEAINLDVIPGTPKRLPTPDDVKYACEQGLENFLYMKDRSDIDITPVYHLHEPVEYLHEYIRHEPHKIALAPMKGETRKNKFDFLDFCFSVIPKKQKIHGLALSNSYLLSSFPFDSTDSTSWKTSPAFGEYLQFEDGLLRRPALKNMPKREGIKRTVIALKEFETYCTEYWKTNIFVPKMRQPSDSVQIVAICNNIPSCKYRHLLSYTDCKYKKDNTCLCTEMILESVELFLRNNLPDTLDV